MGATPKLGALLAIPIPFKRTLPFRTGTAGIEITATKDPAVLQAIVGDSAFPGASDVQLGEVSVNAQSGQDLKFLSSEGSVSFKANAATNFGFGMYLTPANLLKAITLDQHVGENLTLAADPNSFYMLLDWGFDVSGSAAGGVALGAPSIKFSADADLAQNFAVFRQFQKKTANAGIGARTSIAETLDSLVLPKFVKDDTDIASLTWVYSLIEGDVKGSVGATYGYDFNWVHEAQFAGLKGDLSLKIQASISANVGFTLSGRWAVIVSRDSESRVVRVRVFRRPTKGWNFALNAGAAVTPNTGTLLPSKMDDLIAAILGIYAPQLLKDLSALKDWASGNAPLSGALSNLSSEYMLKMIGSVYEAVNGPNSTFNPDQDFAKARDSILKFLDTWGGLDSKLASMVWKLVPGRNTAGQLDPTAAAVMNTILSATTQIANGTRPDFSQFLDQIPGLSGFLAAPLGQFVQSLAGDSLLTSATSDAAFAEMQKLAKTVLPFVQAGSSEQALLQALHDWIDPRLKLSQITDAVTAGTGDIKDGWLQAKLADFLEQRVFGIEEIKKIDALITNLRTRANDYYAKALKALNTTYGASLAATYASTSTNTSLIDAEFDFGNSNADANRLRTLMASTIAGDFTDVLLNDVPGVKLNKASLSHGLNRQSHIELRLPFYSSTIDHINASLSSANPVDAEGGRLVMYQLDASDSVSSITNRGGNYSHLAMGAQIPVSAGNQTRVFGNPTFTYSYSYRQAARNMQRDQLQYQVKPYLDQYLPEAFTTTPFDKWLTEMDRAVTHADSDHYGYALLSIELGLAGTTVTGWLQAPTVEKSFPYMNMSLALQVALRKVIPFFYFADAKNYATLQAAFLAIAYTAMPVSTSARLDGNTLHLNTGQSVYWDWMDHDLRKALLFSSATEAKLRAMLPAIYQRLQAAGMKDTAKFFEPGDGTVRRVRAAADQGDAQLQSLLFTEAEIIQGALQAGLQLARFRENKGSDVKQATRALAAFGAKITDTFNARVASIYGGDALRPLGTVLFSEAAQALSGDSSSPNAMFRFLVLDPKAPFSPADFLHGSEPDSGILVQQYFVNAH